MSAVLEDSPPAPAPSRTTTTAVVSLFIATSFLSAFLLFLVQPMVAKLVLPPYGGSPAVWNTTNAFFQATLVAGYAYSHVLSTRAPRRRQAPIHAVALALPLVALPLSLPSWVAPPADRPPALWLVLVLIVSIGAPFLAVSTTGPLLQRWFSYTDHPRAVDPYFLYAAGNVGSFLALLAYPLLLESRWPLGEQARIWARGYALLVVLVVVCGFAARGATSVEPEHPGGADEAGDDGAAPAPTARERLTWLALAAVPSTLMLGVTSFITADLAAVPLLWAVPLAAYLATFVVAFGRPGHDEPRLAAGALVAALVVVGALVVGDAHVPLLLAVGAHVVLFTAGAYVAHRRLAIRRPAPAHLTGFYLVVALGGVLGGGWNAFVAPLVFDRVVEYPLAILAVAVVGLAPLRRSDPPPLRRRYGRVGLAVEVGLGFGLTFASARVLDGWVAPAAVIGLVVAAAAAVAAGRAVPALAVGAAALVLVQVLAPLANDPGLERRTFFGVYRVDRFPDHVELISGSTSHGAQDPSRPDEPLSYYTRRGPVGQLMDVFGGDAEEVGLVGLGVGALAAYGDEGQRFTFYEIDPEVVRIARDSGWFTYLADTEATVEFRVGDGRLELEETGDRVYDVLVLDAFSGDSIPVHLLTAEAFELYADRLAPGGVIAVHISNRYLDLRPVIAGSAAANGLASVVRRDSHAAGAGTSASWWVAVADPATLTRLEGDDRWHPGDEAGVVRWTDQRSNILDVLGVDDP